MTLRKIKSEMIDSSKIREEINQNVDDKISLVSDEIDELDKLIRDVDADFNEGLISLRSRVTNMSNELNELITYIDEEKMQDINSLTIRINDLLDKIGLLSSELEQDSESKVAILSGGINTLELDKKSNARIAEINGRTVVNYVPLFDSGVWSFDNNVTVNSPTKITINHTQGVTQIYQANIKLKTDVNYALNGNVDSGGYVDLIIDGVFDSVGIGEKKIGADVFMIPESNNPLKIRIVIESYIPTGTYAFENISINEGSTPQPFVANVQGITNPTITVTGKNLLKSFHRADRMPVEANPEIVSDSKIKLGANNNGDFVQINFKVLRNTDYSFSAIKENMYTAIYETNLNTSIKTYNTDDYTFNSGDNDELTFVFKSVDITKDAYLENIMINIGSTALPFEPMKQSSITALTTLYDGDKLYLGEDNQLKVSRINKEIILDESINWVYDTHVSGVKVFYFKTDGFYDVEHIVKHDGVILNYYKSSWANPDTFLPLSFNSNSASSNIVEISISNKDSGWGDDYTPTPEEVRAYFLGWKMRQANTEDSPYVDGVKWWRRISYNDNPTNILPTTMAEINSKWQPYKLVYKLANPIIENVKTIGNLTLDKGFNTLEVNEGRIVREVANPFLDSTGYNINNGVRSDYTQSLTEFKIDKFIDIYKNGYSDFSNWTLYPNTITKAGALAQFLDVNNFDATAVYTVDYIPLEPYRLTAPIENITIEYQSNLGGVVNQLVEDIADVDNRLDIVESDMVRKGEKSKFITPTILNGWVAFQDGYSPRFTKDSLGYVYIDGAIRNGNPTRGTTLFILPKEYRPKSYKTFVVANDNQNPSGYGSRPVEISISPTGHINIGSIVDYIEYLSLDGIIFKVE